MKIYNRSNFFLGSGYLAIAVISGIKGFLNWDMFTMVMALMWAGLAAAYLRRALDQKQAETSREASARSNAAARELFGKWWLAAEAFGGVLFLLSMLLQLARPGNTLSIVLLVAGLAYTIVIVYVIDHQAR